MSDPLEIGVRTIEGTASNNSDFIPIDKKIEFLPGDIEQTVEVTIINDDTFEPNEDFYIELYDPETNKKLPGDDTRTTITIIDDDQPGKLGFTTRHIKVKRKDKAAKLKIIRQAGTDGQVSVKFKATRSKDMEGTDNNAENSNVIVAGTVTFEQGENEKMIVIPITSIDVIEAELFSPTGGATLSKKALATVEVVGDNEVIQKAKGIEEIINLMRADQNVPWKYQFKQAVMLSPQVDEKGIIDDITIAEALVHFVAIGWKVLFA